MSRFGEFYRYGPRQAMVDAGTSNGRSRRHRRVAGTGGRRPGRTRRLTSKTPCPADAPRIRPLRARRNSGTSRRCARRVAGRRIEIRANDDPRLTPCHRYQDRRAMATRPHGTCWLASTSSLASTTWLSANPAASGTVIFTGGTTVISSVSASWAIGAAARARMTHSNRPADGAGEFPQHTSGPAIRTIEWKHRPPATRLRPAGPWSPETPRWATDPDCANTRCRGQCHLYARHNIDSCATS